MNIFQEVFASVSKANHRKANTCRGIENISHENRQIEDKSKSLPRSKSPICQKSSTNIKNEESFLAFSKHRRSKTPTAQNSKIPISEKRLTKEEVDPKQQINKKKLELHQVELQIINARAEIAQLQKSLRAEKERTRKLKAENKRLNEEKSKIETQNRIEDKEVQAVANEKKEILRKHEEFLEYKYNEIVCERDDYMNFI